ncbi:integral membrane protein [Aspergillus piperis CBS 112811]|uniref:Integral membrane protein n=1 Tax=Aspergillus piperis CBS 112811 TaxID=1448313 RepID=A0A8G1R4H7_9EURO|nr:integral membrane protein [Aspergillus piperis CBS 112811]RAH56665.1 integral membrane protein [Aspergillus piperis CBS 112811]
MLLPRRLLRPCSLIFLNTHTCHLLLIFIFLYGLAINLARLTCWRDPTSAFFAEEQAYKPAYSTLRTEQANELIQQANSNTLPQHFQTKASAHPTMCVGIASVARKGARYLQGAVGSILEGLTATEREDMYLIIFIAHSDPAEHPAYTEPWLRALADKVLVYDPDVVDIEHIRSLETPEAKKFAREKGLFDYTYLLKECGKQNTSYTVMLEDDVVALDGWYHRTKQALNVAERKAEEEGVEQWLYLRLFYTEIFLGWNSEEWPIYLFFSLLAVSVIVATTTATRYCCPSTARNLSNEIITILSLVVTPLLIALFFAAGRHTMLPIPEGVHAMPKFGCCSQGFVFPQARIGDLVCWYESNQAGYVDMLTESYADQNGEVRWALTPSVLQHVGSRSSKTNALGKHRERLTMAERIWNFGFEENDPGELRLEHRLRDEGRG